MADEVRKEVIVDIKLNQQDAETRVTKLNKTITELQADTAKLVETNKKLASVGKENTQQYQENSKGIQLNKQLISEATTQRKNLIQTILAEDNSIKALQLRNKELDENNRIIRANVSQLEQQKINIGNYASALDGVLPGISGYVKGTEAMITTSRTFIATPIGAIIGALGLALGALIAYFKGSEEGQDRLNKIMQVGSAIMGKVMDIVRDLGEALFNAATNPKQAFEDLVNFLKDQVINRLTAMAVVVEGIVNLDFKQVANGLLQFATGVEDVLGKAEALYDELAATAELAIEQGTEVARLQKEIRELERAYRKEEAETALRVGKLKEQAAFLEGDAKRKVIEEAIALEQKLADKQVEIAKQKLRLAEIEDAIADNTIDDNNRLVDAQVALINAETARYQNTLKLQKQLATALEEDYRLRLERHEAHLQQEHELFLEQQAKRDEERKREEEIIKNFNKRIADDLKKRLDDEDKAQKKALKDYETIQKLRVQATVGGLAIVAKEQSAARIIGNTILQKDAIKETFINTRAAAMAAYKSLASIPIIGPALGAAAAAAAILYGGSQVAAIAGIQFANGGKVPGYAGGGLSGTKIQNHHGIPIQRSNGDNRLATVKTGEVILNEHHQRLLGGDKTFRAIGVPGFADGGITGSLATSSAARSVQDSIERREMLEALSAVRTVLVLQDFESAMEAKNTPINKAQVI
jgi:predicted HicB family RNase H-like nuclease